MNSILSFLKNFMGAAIETDVVQLPLPNTYKYSPKQSDSSGERDKYFGRAIVEVSDSSISWTKADANNYNLESKKNVLLTEGDIEVLKERKLDIEKARVLKPYWAKGTPRKDCATYLGSGFSESVVGIYYAVFNFVARNTKASN